MVAVAFPSNRHQPNMRLTLCKLRFPRPLRASEVPKLRGYFGQAFAEHEIVHHHASDGRLIYQYPRVQFKVIDRECIILGLEDGADLVGRMWLEVDAARIGEEMLPILESHVRSLQVPFGECERNRACRFATPWLALNQVNAKRYQEAESDAARNGLLGKILVGNCLSMAKSFGHTVGGRLEVTNMRLRPVHTTLKGTPMIGFRGQFTINFDIPPLAGIGKSVSRGFGAVVLTDDDSLDPPGSR